MHSSARSPLARYLVAVTALVLISGCASTPAEPSSSASDGSTGGTPSTSQPPRSFVVPDPNARFDPVALAEAVVGADSDAAREQAIVNALAGIGLGIYTAEGEPIVSGAERTSTDFMVYDFEVTALSGGIADGDDVFLDDIAAELSVMNVSAGGTPYSAEEFASAVTTATAAAMASPDQTAGYALRLARELGMRRATPIDLATPPGGGPIVLDPLAGFLVAADISLPRILGAEPPVAAGQVMIASAAGVANLTAADPCTKFRRQVGTNWYAGMTRLPGSNATNASFSRSLQARLIGGTVKVGGSYESAWHRRHPGDPATSKVYFVGLQLRVAVPPRINCGPIRFAGGQIRGGGQIVDAEVTWTHPGLEGHGRIDCPADCQKTDAQGVARLIVEPHEEPPPGGIGPEFTTAIPVTAEVNLFRALGPDLFGVLSLPPDMRVLARKQMTTDVSWHRAYEISVAIDSQLYGNKAQAGDYANHVGTGTLSGVLDVDTLHRPGDIAQLPPKIGTLVTVTDKGTGPLCAGGLHRSEGSITVMQNSGTIDFQVIEAVVYPPEDLYLYLDVGPADDYMDDTYRLVQCVRGVIVVDTTSKGTNFWEGTIFRGYPRGLAFSGVAMTDGGPTVDIQENVWNLRASRQDWEGNSDFVVAVWETPQVCGGYCDSGKSWLNMTILARPLPDP
jgi:hypothetical protein